MARIKLWGGPNHGEEYNVSPESYRRGQKVPAATLLFNSPLPLPSAGAFSATRDQNDVIGRPRNEITQYERQEYSPSMGMWLYTPRGYHQSRGKVSTFQDAQPETD
jgi:hypothetical protein